MQILFSADITTPRFSQGSGFLHFFHHCLRNGCDNGHSDRISELSVCLSVWNRLFHSVVPFEIFFIFFRKPHQSQAFQRGESTWAFSFLGNKNFDSFLMISGRHSSGYPVIEWRFNQSVSETMTFTFVMFFMSFQCFPSSRSQSVSVRHGILEDFTQRFSRSGWFDFTEFFKFSNFPLLITISRSETHYVYSFSVLWDPAGCIYNSSNLWYLSSSSSVFEKTS